MEIDYKFCFSILSILGSYACFFIWGYQKGSYKTLEEHNKFLEKLVEKLTEIMKEDGYGN